MDKIGFFFKYIFLNGFDYISFYFLAYVNLIFKQNWYEYLYCIGYYTLNLLGNANLLLFTIFGFGLYCGKMH